ncbi:restriction endonuclease subunit S [Pasteurella canis]|nr:restriction endonuclease subunit S [Pasteurella canis]
MSSSELSAGDIPRISAKSDNNGVLGYYSTLNSENARHFENFISVNFFGTDGGIFYHPYKASVEMKVHTLKILGTELNRRTGNFIASALRKVLCDFGYGNQLSSSKLKELDFRVVLPTLNGKIDFDFMENFISQLEAFRISQLEAYLLATGLKDYTLNPEENQSLRDFECGKIQWKTIKITDLFNVKNTRNILSRDIVENSGDIPYLSASRENNSVSSYISYDENYLDEGNCIFIGGKTFVVTYQEKDFYSNDSHNLSLYLKETQNRNRHNQLFLASCIYKGLDYKYSWGDSISNKKIQVDVIRVPMKNNKLDYDYMALLISAIQKLVIKDVVLYADRKIAATKQIIECNNTKR